MSHCTGDTLHLFISFTFWLSTLSRHHISTTIAGCCRSWPLFLVTTAALTNVVQRRGETDWNHLKTNKVSESDLKRIRNAINKTATMPLSPAITPSYAASMASYTISCWPWPSWICPKTTRFGRTRQISFSNWGHPLLS